ncbi:MAG: hypothetical protein A4E52_00474 [Pelotomaculum sp. PtaB.Bin013]|nr:MAG: hypothetical protein A4E52_00474 [Pelotomaculum sp. PtaB.Bin013]
MVAQAINVALMVYGIAFVIGFGVAFLMKGMQALLKTK